MKSRIGLGSVCVLGLAIAMTLPAFAQAPAGQPPAAPAAGAGRGPTPTPPCGPAVSGTNVGKGSRCFELRTYTVQPEGPGSIDLLHSRFRDHTTALFLKHGMTIVGFWQPLSKPNALIYLMAYKDNATRDAEWAAFNTDPEWVKTRTEMNVRVVVESVFMNATDYSPMK